MSFTFTAMPSLTRPVTFDSDCESFFGQLPAYQVNLEALAAQCEANATTLLSLEDIRSDIDPLIAQKVSLSGAESISGVKTFVNRPIIPNPTAVNNPMALGEFQFNSAAKSVMMPTVSASVKRIFMIQTGEVNVPSDSSVTVTYPTPFLALLGWPMIAPYHARMGSTSDGEVTANAPTVTNFEACNGKNVAMYISWLAMGYVAVS